MSRFRNEKKTPREIRPHLNFVVVLFLVSALNREPGIKIDIHHTTTRMILSKLKCLKHAMVPDQSLLESPEKVCTYLEITFLRENVQVSRRHVGKSIAIGFSAVLEKRLRYFHLKGANWSNNL